MGRGGRGFGRRRKRRRAVRVYGAYLPVLVILPVLLRRPRSCVFVRGLLALRDERAAAERHGRDSARGRRIRPRWVGRWVTCEASAWPHARALAGLKTRLLRGTNRGPRRGSMDPRSVRSFASVRGSPSVEVLFTANGNQRVTARTKRRGFELARALSLTPRRARVRREVATSTVCRPARAEALSLSSRAESSIGEPNLFPDSQPEHWCAGGTSQPDGNRAWHFQPRKNLTVPTVRCGTDS